MPAVPPLAAPPAAAVRPGALPPAEARAAKEFESMFLAEMLAPMFQGLARSTLFGGAGQEIWSSLLTQEYGRVLASRGGLGLGESVMRQLVQQQEVR